MLTLAFILLGAGPVAAGNDVARHALETLNRERIGLNLTAAIALGVWTTLHILASGFGWVFVRQPRWRAFHQMNALFNVPILGTAVFGGVVALNQQPEVMTFEQSLGRGLWLERLLLIGIALDALGAAGGAFFWDRGLRLQSARSTGYGQALLFQCTVLLIFDIAVWLMNVPYTGQLVDWAAGAR